MLQPWQFIQRLDLRLKRHVGVSVKRELNRRMPGQIQRNEDGTI
jgi:hypothetical protein